MTTDRQMDANRHNALASTGPQTTEGKAAVARNAIQHGIFAKHLIISTPDWKESQADFDELHQGLIDQLHPDGKLECVLVEKIAIDYWRLARVIRYETGSIRESFDTAITPQTQRPHADIDLEIADTQETIKKNDKILGNLVANKVFYSNPIWEGDGLTIDVGPILASFIEANNIRERCAPNFISNHDGSLPLHTMNSLIKELNYTGKDINDFLAKKKKEENIELRKIIARLERQKQRSGYDAEVSVQVRNLPQEDRMARVIRYEKALQKSISQNLRLLENLQAKK